jgi:hypothetical protein
MKVKPNFETYVHALVIILSLITFGIVLCSSEQFKDAKIVYQGF